MVQLPGSQPLCLPLDAQVLLEQVEWGPQGTVDRDSVEFQLQDVSAATLARLVSY